MDHVKIFRPFEIRQALRLATYKTNAAQLIGIPVSTRIQGLHWMCCRAWLRQIYAVDLHGLHIVLLGDLDDGPHATKSV